MAQQDFRGGGFADRHQVKPGQAPATRLQGTVTKLVGGEIAPVAVVPPPKTPADVVADVQAVLAADGIAPSTPPQEGEN